MCRISVHVISIHCFNLDVFMFHSTGELLRRERARPGSKYGELIENTIVAGNIVPAEITCALLHNAMDSSGGQFDKFNLGDFMANLGFCLILKLKLFKLSS